MDGARCKTLLALPCTLLRFSGLQRFSPALPGSRQPLKGEARNAAVYDLAPVTSCHAVAPTFVSARRSPCKQCCVLCWHLPDTLDDRPAANAGRKLHAELFPFLSLLFLEFRKLGRCCQGCRGDQTDLHIEIRAWQICTILHICNRNRVHSLKAPSDESAKTWLEGERRTGLRKAER